MKRSIPPLCIAVVALVIAVQSMRRRGEEQAQHGQASAPAAAPCSDKQHALVDGLDAGQSLGDFRVIGLRCAQPKVLEIDLRRDATPLVLIVAEPGAVPHNAPRQTSGHDLYYTKQTPQNEAPTQQEIDALLVLLAKRVEAAEKKLGSGQ